jgi:predicted secreted Zn-dependent protease
MRQFRRSLTWCLLTLAGCNPPPDLKGDAPGYAEAALEPFPGTRTKYYLVEGTEPAAIIQSMREQGLDGNEKDGRFAVGVTRWEAKWRWPVRSDGRCDLSRLNLDFDVTVILPQLANENASPEVRRRWGNFMAALVAHEAGHVRLITEHHEKIIAAIEAASCETAQAAANAAIADLIAANDRYDAASDSAATQPVDELY